MGSYSTCWLENFMIGSTKYSVDHEIICLFRDADKKVLPASDPNIPEQLKHYEEEKDELDDEDLQVVYYEANAAEIKERLNVLGYTLETSRAAFIEWVRREREDYKRYAENSSGVSFYTEKEKILSELTPETWLSSLKEIRKKNLKLRPDNKGKKDTLIDYMLREEWYGFPGADVIVALRLMLEEAKPNDNLVYDLTDLIWSGEYEPDERMVEYSLATSADEYVSKAKIIILTEGRTDTWILKESLQLLYPHLADYYSFIEFETAKVGGGVGPLANMVKSFSGAGVVNNIIALFDNDTAAAAACKSLETLPIPANVKIVKLPEVDFLKNYPTLGPEGEALSDVNGVAASIELYLGEDVLRLDGTNLTPIQWTGFDRGIQKYQGEVLDKQNIHENFEKKLSLAKKKKDLANNPDWDHLRMVFETIFSAFDDKNRELIFGFIEKSYDQDQSS